MKSSKQPRHPAPRVLALALLIAWVAPLAPSHAQLGGQPDVTVATPPEGQPAFGLVEVRVDVRSGAPIRHVDCLVDGIRQKRLVKPPFRWVVDFGEDNEEKVIEIEATTVVGTVGRATRTTPRIEVDEVMEVELLQLYAVVERGGRRVRDLTKADFRIVDDGGREQEIVTVEGGELPISATLLVDSSASMRGARLEAALQGARAFTAGLGEEDEAMLVLFSDQILRKTPFTNDAGVLDLNVEGVSAVGSTAINDHLYYALNRLDARLGRRVLVLLSDGDDITSLLPMQDVLWRARRSQAVVYWIRLDESEESGDGPRRFTSSWRDEDGNLEEQELLRRAVLDSGGREIVVRALDELEASFTEVMAELRDQYVLGFYPRERRHDGSWREFSLRVRGPGKVRSRGGFIDD